MQAGAFDTMAVHREGHVKSIGEGDSDEVLARAGDSDASEPTRPSGTRSQPVRRPPPS